MYETTPQSRFSAVSSSSPQNLQSPCLSRLYLLKVNSQVSTLTKRKHVSAVSFCSSKFTLFPIVTSKKFSKVHQVGELLSEQFTNNNFFSFCSKPQKGSSAMPKRSAGTISATILAFLFPSISLTSSYPALDPAQGNFIILCLVHWVCLSLTRYIYAEL